MNQQANELTAVRTFLESRSAVIHTILYPGCGEDTSPSDMYPAARVIYVDIDPNPVKKLRARGFEVYEADGKSFRTETPVDLLFMRNPSVRPDGPLHSLSATGYVVCNDYHQTATRLKDIGLFELLARTNNRGEIITTELDLYWQPVETDEELHQAAFSFARAIPPIATDVVARALGHKPKSVTAAYADLFARAQRATKQRLLTDGVKEGSIKFDIEMSMPSLTVNNETIGLLPLPPKRGSVDDLFIFA